MLGKGLINFTIAQSVGRLFVDKQEQLTQYAVVNKISGRFLSTQMVPYLIQNPDASPAQAFEHARVGDWKRPSNVYQRGEVPPTDVQVEKFLDALCALGKSLGKPRSLKDWSIKLKVTPKMSIALKKRVGG